MSNRRKNERASTKKLTVCAMLSALGVVLLYIGSLIEVVDISMAVIASMLCIIAVIEYNSNAAWMIFGVTAILSLLLLPNKTPASFYVLFFGFYPILKEKLEKLKKVLSWVLKEIVFNVCLVLMVLVSIFVFTIGENELITPITVAIAIVLSEAVFILYDIALTRLITFYIINLRPRLKLNK